MFEAVELGRKLSKEEFAQGELKLRSEILELQWALRKAKFGVLLLVSGVEGAGKSDVVNRLSKWLDTRGIRTYTFWEESDEERERPRYWRFWRALPPAGRIHILFGSWYTQPIISRVFGEKSETEFERELLRIEEFERMLSENGTVVLKLWFHVSKKDQAKRLKGRSKGKGKRASPWEKKFAKRYDDFLAVSERTIRVTDTGPCPWHLIESKNRRYRDLTAGRILLDTLRRRLALEEASPKPAAEPPSSIPAETTILDQVDLSQTLSSKEYESRLEEAQQRVNELTWQAYNERRSTVVVFEGWDASGKGGAIRRVAGSMDARLYRVIPIAAPSDEEKAHHYLWRFWRRIPRAGYLTIFDRSWYGRVLVERVEGFATDLEWRRSFQEINDFEEQLSDHGIVVHKFWIHLSKDEQLRRFRDREQTPHKQHKITEEDWRNREQWDLYQGAVNEMVARTSTKNAPWTLVAGDDKQFARVQILETLVGRLESALGT